MGDKLFKPEDFDKTPKETKASHRVILIIASISTILLIIVVAFIYWSNTNSKEASIDGQSVDTSTQSEQNLLEGNSGSTHKDTIPKSRNITLGESQEPEAKKDTQIEKLEVEQNNSFTKKESVVSGSVEEKARQVIRGDYGNGNVRKQKLGEEYAEIQSAVNEMYRKGLVK